MAVAAIGAFSQTTSAPLLIQNQHDITISNLVITGGAKHCIQLQNCYNVHITKCILVNSTLNAIDLYKCTNILIDSCSWTLVKNGVYALNSIGIQVISNRGLNMGHDFVQFNNVSGAGNKINYNKFENILGATSPEDGINLFKSNGLPADPIQIIGNWIRGGGPSTSGGGIVMGDYGGSWQYAAHNILVQTGSNGLGLGGGDHNTAIDNIIYATALSSANTGISINNANYLNESCFTNTIAHNYVNWTSIKYGNNPYWLATGLIACQIPIGFNTNIWKANITNPLPLTW